MAEQQEKSEKRTSNTLDTLQGVSEKPVFRQLALMVGIAASVALGAAVILWSQSPDYSVLYNDIPESQFGEISDALKQQNIDFKLDPVNGKVMVPAAQLSKARINLASMGLHKVTPKGFEILNQEQGFGTSQFIQNARYHKALEDELAMSIASMRNIKNARIHLAIPKQSVFIRDRKKPTASVILELYAGRSLNKNQVAAITNMVSSSVEDMNTTDVTIVDQLGRLLTDSSDDNGQGINDKQMLYTQKLETSYNDKVSNILTPFLGTNGFRVQVKANMDFDRKEVTSEQYNPDLSAIRSKQQLVEKSSGSGISGIPGALSNQPPGGSIVPEKLNKGKGGEEGGSKGPYRSRETLTENFEVDKSISHIAYSTGKITQLSVAVVIDDKKITGDKGAVTSTPRSSEEIQQITALIKEAVGYNIQRGDTVNVINLAFVKPEPLEALPEIPVWEQSWFMSIVKQVLAGLVVLYLLFGVIRPAFTKLSKPYGEVIGLDGDTALAAGAIDSDGAVVGVDKDGNPIGIGSTTAHAVDADGNALPSPDEIYQMELELARKLVVDDPKVAAQVIKNWIN
ncbi:MAG: flagellar basal-body MS-ring/collar protein FliF [Pseudomonadota bacterium]